MGTKTDGIFEDRVDAIEVKVYPTCLRREQVERARFDVVTRYMSGNSEVLHGGSAIWKSGAWSISLPPQILRLRDGRTVRVERFLEPALRERIEADVARQLSWGDKVFQRRQYGSW